MTRSNKTVFIIPGYKQKATNKAYKAIAKILKGQGYKPILVNIPWKQTTISQNTKYFLKKYKRISTRKKYILGFSFGAMIAFLATTKVSPSGVILCSLSPYFKEDLKRGNKRNKLTQDRYEDFSKLPCSILAKKVKAKEVHMLYGTKEDRSLKKRVSQAFNQIESTNKFLTSVKQVEHNIGDRRYLQKIHEAARHLSY